MSSHIAMFNVTKLSCLHSYNKLHLVIVGYLSFTFKSLMTLHLHEQLNFSFHSVWCLELYFLSPRCCFLCLQDNCAFFFFSIVHNRLWSQCWVFISMGRGLVCLRSEVGFIQWPRNTNALASFCASIWLSSESLARHLYSALFIVKWKAAWYFVK